MSSQNANDQQASTDTRRSQGVSRDRSDSAEQELIALARLLGRQAARAWFPETDRVQESPDEE